ncbi:MAG: catalase [Candidatus Eremiobacteraeota bacterium]|nr:catalase [Candidatus Eremiobacteraeota bacterium]
MAKKNGESKKPPKLDEPSLKVAALEPFRASPAGKPLTSNQGLKISDDQNQLRASDRGPTLMEDFIYREKMTHFDHERIPERVVHARGAAAHGYFQVYESMAPYTKAAFLQDPSVKTPVFVRFSTVGGSRGSADTPRDVRGFAVKFYTQEGNFDLVGNNMPVFFIQDAIKFPDFVHAVKPEPHNEIPQASSAHDTLWDFVSLTLESTHMMMWLMSDRSLPRAYANMEGFGVHTFRFINANEESRYVKFHWKPLLGVHSLVWDEAQKLAGKDPDFNRRDLFESIDNGKFPEWELGVQLFGDEEADGFDFDILDSTKLIPEELIPVKRIGKLVLDRNPDSFFAETEQVAFCTTHIVPGIDFTNDPLLQGRNFSYLDTQLSRLGGPNFHEIPINRPVCPFSNGQRDGFHRMRIDTGDTSYQPNSLDGGMPAEVPREAGGFASYPERIDGVKRRLRSESFGDHFSQAKLFWNSMSPVEKQHITAAFTFELSKLNRVELRERVVTQMLANVDAGLATEVAARIGLSHVAISANGAKSKKKDVATSPLLSQLNPATGVLGNLTTRKVAILAAPGSNAADIKALKKELLARGAQGFVLAERLGSLEGENGSIAVDRALVTMPSVTFDAVFVPGGAAAAESLSASGEARHFIAEAFKHGKAIAAVAHGANVVGASVALSTDPIEGLVFGDTASEALPHFLEAIGNHRAWSRSDILDAVPA